jgi:dTDP-4-dehydrorhamnose reductase
MKLLILGGTGMLGHMLWRVCRDRFDTWTTMRGAFDAGPGDLYREERTIAGLDALDFDRVAAAVRSVRPHAIVNCVGLVKQHPLAADADRAAALNARLPHRLAALATDAGCRLVHISTDCVFSGRRGNYREEDPTDAEDLYGQSKADGEVAGRGVLTLRLSLIGRELHARHGLVEWFLSQRGGHVRGHTQAFFSGVTTHVAANAIVHVLSDHPSLDGIRHLAAERISKHSLLMLLNDAYRTGTTIEPSRDLVIDRSLCGDAFRDATGWSAPSWPQMVTDLAADTFPYDRQRAPASHSWHP